MTTSKDTFLHRVLKLTPRGRTFLERYQLESAQDSEKGRGFRSILFIDLDHTVMQGSFSFAVWEVACGEIARMTGRPVDEIRLLVAEENQKRIQDTNVPAVDAMDWDDIVETVARRLGVTPSKSVLELVESYAKEPFIKELDQAREVLTKLKRPDRAIVAATNGLAKYQFPALKALGLLDVFNDILSPDQSNVLKDNRAFYEPWRWMAPVKIMVGDSYRYDVEASLGYGFKAVWYLNGRKSQAKTSEPCDPSSKPLKTNGHSGVKIRSLRELPRIVRRFERRARNRKRLATVVAFFRSTRQI